MDVVSFFAGCGGLDLGFEQAGFRVVWANDFEPTVRDTYLRNHPGTKFLLADLNSINPDDIPNCDGFIGGPPCQSWSVAGKQKGLEDERGQLFLKYIDMIEAKKPKFFVIENVKGLLDNVFKEVFTMFLDRLDKTGYEVKWQLLDAVNYRIPQNRERVFIIGFRKDLNVVYDFPKPTCCEPIPLSKAIGDIIEEPRRYKNERIESINSVLPNHDVYVGSFGSYYRRGNRRRPWERSSFTIHATGDNAPLHPNSPKMVYFGHENWDFQQEKQKEYRRLSVRECARIQTFPDSFIFDGTDIKALYKMIGNAVPPRLGRVIAESISATLDNINVEQEVPSVNNKNILEACTLVGYFKNNTHHDLIIRNLLYYVRSDGRKGSMFKEDCSTMPELLLLHHKDKTEIFELDGEEPFLADASFLKSLGFETNGNHYLCFKLKDPEKLIIHEAEGILLNSNIINCYTPFFTSLGNLLNKEYERRQ